MLSITAASVWEWTAWVIRVVALVAIIGLASILAYAGRRARPWVFLALLAATGVAIAMVVVGIHRWNTLVEEYVAAYITVGIIVAAAPIVLLWGLVASFRRRTALWQTLAGSILSFLVLGATFITYVGDG